MSKFDIVKAWWKIFSCQSNSIVDKMSDFANGWLQNLQSFVFLKFFVVD